MVTIMFTLLTCQLQVCSLYLLHTAFFMIGLIQIKGLIINPLRLNINIQIPWTDIHTFCTFP